MSTPVAASSSSFWSRSVSSSGADSGRTTMAGWRSNVTTADRRTHVAGQPAHVGDDRPVAEVHTVVGADGDDAALQRALTALEVGHHLHAQHAIGRVV